MENQRHEVVHVLEIKHRREEQEIRGISWRLFRYIASLGGEITKRYMVLCIDVVGRAATLTTFCLSVCLLSLSFSLCMYICINACASMYIYMYECLSMHVCEHLCTHGNAYTNLLIYMLFKGRLFIPRALVLGPVPIIAIWRWLRQFRQANQTVNLCD